MKKYYISYRNLLNNNKINKKIDINSIELKVFKQIKENKYIVESMVNINNGEDLIKYIDKMENNNLGISFMVELDEKEKDMFNPFYVKEFDKKNNHILVKDKCDSVELLNYNVLINLKVSDINEGKVLYVEENNNFLNINFENNEELICSKHALIEKRKSMQENCLGSDIYFYTEDNEIKNKYSDEVVSFVEKDIDKYSLDKQRIFVIDSISQDRIYDISSNSYRCLFNICNSSIPISIIDNNNGTYNIENYSKNDIYKKAYLILKQNFINMLCDTSITPLLKYINVYELNDGVYNKTCIEEYMKRKDILKYIKKPDRK